MKQESNEFLVVALGASAGGLEPLETFFRHMAPDAGFAFVIIQHLAPDHPTALPQLLGRHTAMPVRTTAVGGPHKLSLPHGPP